MVQALGKQKDVTVDSITATVDDRIVAKWKRRGVCPWSAGDQFSDPSCQNWTEQEHHVTPQQKKIREYVCHQSRMWQIYSTMYAVREWSIDFVKKSHVNNARNWMGSMPRNQRNSEPGTVQVWRALRAMGSTASCPLL